MGMPIALVRLLVAQISLRTIQMMILHCCTAAGIDVDTPKQTLIIHMVMLGHIITIKGVILLRLLLFYGRLQEIRCWQVRIRAPLGLTSNIQLFNTYGRYKKKAPFLGLP